MIGESPMQRRRRLLGIARRYAERLRKKPGVAGLVLYGSLAGDSAELTGFSDVDMAVILDRPMPAHFTEHRLVEGVKADLLLFHRDSLREIGMRTLGGLVNCSWTEELLIKGLVHGGADTVLFDPRGEIALAKRRLGVWATGREIERRRAAAQIRETEGVLDRAAAALRRRKWKEALHLSSHQIWRFPGLVLDLAGTKRLREAERRLGIPPSFGRTMGALKENLTSGREAVEAARRADEALWEFLLREVWAPVEAQLRREGVKQPNMLEVAGEHPVFWHGNRVHELGRIKAESALTLRWARHELDEGRPYEAVEMLSWFMCPRSQAEHTRGLAAALKARGHDVSRIVDGALRKAEYRFLAKAAREADRKAWRWEVSPARARRFVFGMQKLMREAAEALRRAG